MPSSVDPSKCRRASKEGWKEGRKEGKEAESTPFARERERERERESGKEGRRGPSNLINEINLSAIFGGKVGKGKRGENGEQIRGGAGEKCKVADFKKGLIH